MYLQLQLESTLIGVIIIKVFFFYITSHKTFYLFFDQSDLVSKYKSLFNTLVYHFIISDHEYIKRGDFRLLRIFIIPNIQVAKGV
jgi:hypothetical protein